MTSLESVLATRASLEMAAFFVTWVAVALLVVIVVHLHVRLQRVEQANAPAGRKAAYAHLLGQRLSDLWTIADPWQPGLMLFVSRACPTCDRLIDEMRETSWSTPLSLIYTSPAPTASAPWPRVIRVIENGAPISAALGIHVTPFVVRVGDTGVVEEAAPVSSLDAIRNLAGGTRSATRPTRMDGALKEVTP
jgi:hypothetical protein